MGNDFGTNAGAEFASTQWAMVRMAAQETPEGAKALESLCRAYWRPVYAFTRRAGHGPADAQDVTQEFFLRLIRRHSCASADPGKGRFRTFLLGSLRHFLTDEWDKAHAAKRGGGQPPISLDDEAENYYRELEAGTTTPDQLFAQQWAWTLIDHALRQLASECAAAGKARQFELLRPFLTEEPRSGGYDQLRLELGMCPNTIAKSLQRLRERFRWMVRQAAAQTVASPADLEEELRLLFSA